MDGKTSFGYQKSGLLNALLFSFVVACGDGEYIIYTAMALRNKAFGSALEFVWAADSNVYATRESGSTVKIFKNFKEFKTLKPDYSIDGKKAFRKTYVIFRC